MKATKCDQCGATDTYDEVLAMRPAGWFKIYGSGRRPSVVDVCGPGCMAQYATALGAIR